MSKEGVAWGHRQQQQNKGKATCNHQSELSGIFNERPTAVWKAAGWSFSKLMALQELQIAEGKSSAAK